MNFDWGNPNENSPAAMPVGQAELRKPLFKIPPKTRPVNAVAPLTSFPYPQLTPQQAIQQRLAAAAQQRRNEFGRRHVPPSTIQHVASVEPVQTASRISGGKLRHTHRNTHRNTRRNTRSNRHHTHNNKRNKRHNSRHNKHELR